MDEQSALATILIWYLIVSFKVTRRENVQAKQSRRWRKCLEL
jgi:hypothetical protein